MYDVRATFEVDDEITSAVEGGTPQERYRSWRRSIRDRLSIEHLLPRIERDITRAWPDFTLDTTSDAQRLEQTVRSLDPWNVPFPLAHGVQAMPADDMVTIVTEHRILYRRDLINGTLADLVDLPSTTVLDLGCNAGFFSLDLALRGAQVDGYDLRQHNIDQARFLAGHYGLDVGFEVRDEKDVNGQWDVVLNLGVLYHVTDPIEFIRRTYDLCRHAAIIDTVCHLEPFSGFILFGAKDVGSATEGREEWETHPTYRGAIDTIHAAGFREVYEVVGRCDDPHDLYAAGTRRCFLAIK